MASICIYSPSGAAQPTAVERCRIGEFSQVRGPFGRLSAAKRSGRLHFYTMNRPELTAATCHILGLRPDQGKRAESSAAEDRIRDAG